MGSYWSFACKLLAAYGWMSPGAKILSYWDQAPQHHKVGAYNS